MSDGRPSLQIFGVNTLTHLRAALVVGLLAPLTAAGQAGTTRGAACVDALDPASFYRVPVFLNATVPDQRSAPVLPGADLLTQSVALRVREILHSPEGKLPAADSLVNWRNLWGTIIVTATPDGRFRSRVHASSVMAMNDPRSVLVLVKRALDDVAASGELLMWPDAFADDSASFSITVHRPIVDKSGVVKPVALRQAVPLFTIRTPWESPVDVIRNPRIVYPELSRSNAAIGTVQFAFMVTEAGKADITTVEEVWPDGVRRPSGELLAYYSAFLSAVKRGLPSGQYRPAMIGGCTVSQQVIETFDFKLGPPSR